MNYQLRPTTCEVNIANLKYNINILKKLAQNHPFFCPMVKANAYGHGDVEVAHILEKMNVKRVGVILVEEGIRLRKSGVKADILVFGYFDEKSLKLCLAHKLTPVISSFDFLKLYKKIKKTKSSKIHIKVDTGMNRMGFKPDDWQKLKRYLEINSDINVEGIGTHFLNSEDCGVENGGTQEQLKLFQQAENIFKDHYTYSHCLNSAALLSKLSFKGARPGLAVYGSKSDLLRPNDVVLKEVMTFKSAIVQIKTVKRGETVSYGGIWKAAKDTQIGIIGVGYADGLSRHFSNKIDVLVKGQRVPLIGRVCMDYSMIDLSSLAGKVKLSEEVVIWGKQKNNFISMHEQANKINTITYELMTSVGRRVPRVYVGGKS